LREIHGKGRSARDGSLPWCSPPSFPVAGHRRSETRWLGGSRNLDLRARGGTVAYEKGNETTVGPCLPLDFISNINGLMSWDLNLKNRKKTALSISKYWSLLTFYYNFNRLIQKNLLQICKG
jgi:hypothetical protein